jgi:hypothetical protein
MKVFLFFLTSLLAQAQSKHLILGGTVSFESQVSRVEEQTITLDPSRAPQFKVHIIQLNSNAQDRSPASVTPELITKKTVLNKSAMITITAP